MPAFTNTSMNKLFGHVIMKTWRDSHKSAQGRLHRPTNGIPQTHAEAFTSTQVINYLLLVAPLKIKSIPKIAAKPHTITIGSTGSLSPVLGVFVRMLVLEASFL